MVCLSCHECVVWLKLPILGVYGVGKPRIFPLIEWQDIVKIIHTSPDWSQLRRGTQLGRGGKMSDDWTLVWLIFSLKSGGL